MDSFIADWLNLLLRWGHMIAGIAWIGTSFYFVALDFSDVRTRDGDLGICSPSAPLGHFELIA